MGTIHVPDDTEELLPEGEHIARIEAVEEYEGKSGMLSLHWVFSVRTAIFDAFKVECWTSLEPGANKQWKLRTFLKALELPHKGELHINTEEIVGKTCRIAVSHDTYKDQVQVRVDEILGLAEPEEFEQAYKDPFANC